MQEPQESCNISLVRQVELQLRERPLTPATLRPFEEVAGLQGAPVPGGPEPNPWDSGQQPTCRCLFACSWTCSSKRFSSLPPDRVPAAGWPPRPLGGAPALSGPGSREMPVGCSDFVHSSNLESNGIRPTRLRWRCWCLLEQTFAGLKQGSSKCCHRLRCCLYTAFLRLGHFLSRRVSC